MIFYNFLNFFGGLNFLTDNSFQTETETEKLSNYKIQSVYIYKTKIRWLDDVKV